MEIDQAVGMPVVPAEQGGDEYGHDAVAARYEWGLTDGADGGGGAMISTFACWLRRAYPQWAPRRGHIALVALCGEDGEGLEESPRS
jgi:hypothetical protein